MFLLTPFDVKTSWGRLKLARPLRPGEDGWGGFDVLKGTPWERALTVVDTEAPDSNLCLGGSPRLRAVPMMAPPDTPSM